MHMQRKGKYCHGKFLKLIIQIISFTKEEETYKEGSEKHRDSSSKFSD